MSGPQFWFLFGWGFVCGIAVARWDLLVDGVLAVADWCTTRLATRRVARLRRPVQPVIRDPRRGER